MGKLFPDSKVFKYRYEFEPRLLVEFIKDRYIHENESVDPSVLIEERVKVNGQSVSNQVVIKPGDVLEYTHYRSDEDIKYYNIEIIYEDEWLLAISKPDFLPVIPSNKYYYNSLAIRIKEEHQNIDYTPLHRLDIETSGILLIGKKKESRKAFQTLFQEKKVEKLYQAIVWNSIKTGIIQGDLHTDPSSKIYTKLVLNPEGPPTSITEILESNPWGSFFNIICRPVTGKTNQIRAHLASSGSPIVGDKKYYPDESVYLDWFKYRKIERIIDKLIIPRQALHCEAVSFEHPFTRKLLTIKDQSISWLNKINTLKNKKI